MLIHPCECGRATLPSRQDQESFWEGGAMPRQMTEDEREEFLAAPHIGVLSVAAGDGRPPHTTPVWYGYEPGGSITFFTGTQGRRSRKTGLIEAAGVLSLSVQQQEFPYKYVTVEGTVVASEQPPTAEQM